jgi:hypothetical protein
MADLKISALPASTTPLAGTEVLPIVQSSSTKQVSIANLTAGRSVSVADLAVSTGNIVPGTAAKGINFTANTSAAGMTSKLLNDYEEGTWTPTDASGAGLTFSTALGWYTKIGKLVTVSCRVVYPVTASAFNAFVGGLPFTTQTASLYSPTGAVYNGGAVVAIASSASNVSTVRFYTATAFALIPNSSFSTFTVAFSLSYISA